MRIVPPSKDDFRRTIGRFATGVTIITTRQGHHLHGMTANAVTSVSLDPLLVLVCVDKTADTHDILLKAGVFAVNILSINQQEISQKFATKNAEWTHGMEGVGYRAGATGSPIIEGCIAYLDCRTVTEQHGGDHTIFIGEVVEAAELSDGEPLLFYAGQFAALRHVAQ
ncbi:MAG: flavin reductase family protein [Chloroflexi bacterium]|nr:MAG: flavin reductase family protein [Chloroflexota bacterium]